jgi:hypothetical protein
MIAAHQYIQQKQIQWAMNRGINLVRSEITKGIQGYASTLNQNLFLPLGESARKSFSDANGNEINDKTGNPSKMQAVYSSSALCVNVFQYWELIGQVPVIAAACGFCEDGDKFSEGICFEEKHPVKGIVGAPPNIDVVIHNSNESPFQCFAIESKFAEPYEGTKSGIALAYLKEEDLWGDIPDLYWLAKGICPENNKTHYFDSAQIIRHILGLKSSFGKDRFKLLYLWYDALGKEGAEHREEITAFAEIAKAAGVIFLSLSYQELIVRLAEKYYQEHTEYVKYLTERYL